MASYRYERDIKPEDLVQEKPRELTPAEARANWWHYHWYYVALIAAAVLALGYFAWQRATTVEPDDTVTVVGRTEPDEAFLSALETKLESLSEDVNDDGKIKVEVKGGGQGRLARPAFERQRGLRRFAVFKWLKKLEKYAKPARTGSFRA